MAFPQVAGVRVGAGIQQEPGHLQRRVARVAAVHAGVGQIEDRLPPVWTALLAGLVGFDGQQLARRRDVADGGGGVDGGGRQVWVLLEQGPGTLASGGVVAAVGQARKPKELVDQRRVGESGFADGLAVRVAGQAADGLDVAGQLRPGREPVGPRQRQLDVCPSEPRQLRGVGGDGHGAGMELADQLDGPWVTGSYQTLQGLGQLAELFEVGISGQGTGRHDGLLPVTPAVRIDRPKGGISDVEHNHWPVGLALRADRTRPEARPQR